jgi:hypothetical protein
MELVSYVKLFDRWNADTGNGRRMCIVRELMYKVSTECMI